MTDNSQAEVKEMTVIDAKLPLTWLISSAVAIVLSFGSLYAKMDAQNDTLKDLSSKLEKRDDNMSILLTSLAEVKSNNLTQDAAIARNAEDIADIKHRLEKGH